MSQIITKGLLSPKLITKGYFGKDVSSLGKAPTTFSRRSKEAIIKYIEIMRRWYG